jgi:putative ATP-binding cassette transporter
MREQDETDDDIGLSSGGWRLLTGSRTTLVVSALAGVTTGACSAALLMSINRSFSDEAQSSLLAPLTFLGLSMLALLSASLSSHLLSTLAQDNLFRLRLSLCRRILSAPLRQLQSIGAHRLMAALADDIASVVHALETLPMLFTEAVKLVAICVYLAFLSPILLLFVVAFVALGVFSFRVPQQRALRWQRLARETDDALFAHFRGLTEGCKELKLDARRQRAFLDDELAGVAKRLKEQRSRARTYYVLAELWSQSLYYLSIGAIVFVAARFDSFPRETLIGFTLAIFFIGGSISAIVGAFPTLGQGAAALRNIEALGLEMARDTAAEAPDERGVGRAPQRLELIEVSYRYRDANGERGYLVGPLDLCIEPGELIFLCGGNGGGKTTLALLILGLYAPDEGEIRLGGRVVTDRSRDSYRQNFSAVFADAYVFERLSGYAEDEEALARVAQTLARLGLDHKLRIENGRFSTVDLSRGQRKRLALAAACAADRPFYLFDEWAAEQDPVFREMFYRELLPALKKRGKTVVVITHDEQYFHLADRRLRLEQGKLEEHGASGATRMADASLV